MAYLTVIAQCALINQWSIPSMRKASASKIKSTKPRVFFNTILFFLILSQHLFFPKGKALRENWYDYP